MLEENGYSKDPADWKILMDDGKHEEPTKENIRAAFQWLHEGQDEADSLYFHFSGHGGDFPLADRAWGCAKLPPLKHCGNT